MWGSKVSRMAPAAVREDGQGCWARWPGRTEPVVPRTACLPLGWLLWQCWLASQDEWGSIPSASILWERLVLFYSLDVWWNLPVMLSRPSTFFSGKIINYLNSLIDIGLCMCLFLLSWVLVVCIFWNWSTLSVIKFVDIELFVIFLYYPFNTNKISNVPYFIYKLIIYVFSLLSCWVKLFINFFKESDFGLINFLYSFLAFNLKFFSNFYYFFYSTCLRLKLFFFL